MMCLRFWWQWKSYDLLGKYLKMSGSSFIASPQSLQLKNVRQIPLQMTVSRPGYRQKYGHNLSSLTYSQATMV